MTDDRRELGDLLDEWRKTCRQMGLTFNLKDAASYAVDAGFHRESCPAVALEGQVAAVRALADEWDASFAEGRAMRDEYGNADGLTRMRRLDLSAAAVRAALDPDPADRQEQP